MSSRTTSRATWRPTWKTGGRSQCTLSGLCARAPEPSWPTLGWPSTSRPTAASPPTICESTPTTRASWWRSPRPSRTWSEAPSRGRSKRATPTEKPETIWVTCLESSKTGRPSVLPETRWPPLLDMGTLLRLKRPLTGSASMCLVSNYQPRQTPATSANRSLRILNPQSPLGPWPMRTPKTCTSSVGVTGCASLPTRRSEHV